MKIFAVGEIDWMEITAALQHTFIAPPAYARPLDPKEFTLRDVAILREVADVIERLLKEATNE